MGKRLIIALCLISFSSQAQQEVYVRAGLLNSALTFSPSFMLNRDEFELLRNRVFFQGRLDKPSFFSWGIAFPRRKFSR